MNTRSSILAGTALALVMLAGQAQSAATLLRGPVEKDTSAGMIILAQAEEPVSEEELLRRRAEEEAQRAQEAAPAPAEEAPAEQPPAETPPPPAEAPPPPPAEQPAPPPVEAPPPAPAPAEEPPAEQPPVEAPPPPPPPAAEQPAPAPEAAPTPEAAPAPEPAPEAPTPPAEEAPTPTPAPEAPAAPAPDAPAAETPTPTPAPEAPTPPSNEAPTPRPAPEAPPAPPPPPAAEQPSPEAPASGQQPAAPAPAPAPDGLPPVTEGASEAIGDQAPLLDSAKEAPPAGEQPAPQAAQPATPPAPPPTSDAQAQQLEAPVEVRSLRAEEGRRIDRFDGRRERREGAEVLREIGDRLVIQFGNQTVVRSDDRQRIGRDANEVYYEELPRGRTRETVVRPNGVQVVTVYDRYGDIVERSRFSPDGREHVLIYADGGGFRDRDDRRGAWRDPGRDLPPLRLTIPADEYILDAGSVRNDDIYYDFLDQPPVEPVRRLYSVDEVKYSARVRDSVRRVELDTITFDFGSASISEDAIPRLDGVANAINRLLETNPGEVFLIEGHTDAVGSNEANLALSDRRAEGVATALTNVFGIPPENLVTQGYGENYLKVKTEAQERENRRVAIRRITPLVAPVASAQ